MRWLALVLLLSLVACDEDDPACAEPVGERLHLVPFESTLPPPPEGVTHDGAFAGLEAGQVEFVTERGESFGFVMHSERVELPDLAGERVALTVRGLEPDLGDRVAAVVHAQQRPGGTAWLAGNAELTEPVAGWTVRSPRDVTTCGRHEREGGIGYRKPVTFERDGDAVTLLPGQSASVGDLVLTVVEAESWIRVHPFDPCEPPGCARERLEWTIARADLMEPAP